MALDLSTVSDTQFENDVDLPNYILLPYETITQRDTNEILFQLSESGQLILANFFVERGGNGVYFLKKHLLNQAPHSSTSIEPTDLSLLDLTNVDRDIQQCQTSFTTSKTCQPLSALHASNQYDTNVSNHNRQSFYHALPPPVTEPTTPITSLPSARFSLPPPCEQHSNSITDLSLNGITKEPSVDTTTSCLQSDNTSEAIDDSHSGSCFYTCQKVYKPLSQNVRQILRKLNSNPSSPDSSSSDHIFEGHNLSELQRFARRFRLHRITRGLSQMQLSAELTKHFSEQQTIFSQALLSRFEKLDVTIRIGLRLQPYLERWLHHSEFDQCDSLGCFSDINVRRTQESGNTSNSVQAVGRARTSALARRGILTAPQDSTPPSTLNCKLMSVSLSSPCRAAAISSNLEQDHSNGAHSGKLISDLSPRPKLQTISRCERSGCQLEQPASHRLSRKKRTCFSKDTLLILSAAFHRNSRPKGKELTQLAFQTNHRREEIRVWFCNRRRIMFNNNNT